MSKLLGQKSYVPVESETELKHKIIWRKTYFHHHKYIAFEILKAIFHAFPSSLRGFAQCDGDGGKQINSSTSGWLLWLAYVVQRLRSFPSP